MRTTVGIDDLLMAEAMGLSGARTRSQAVELDLKMVQLHRSGDIQRRSDPAGWSQMAIDP
jgi:Arc/MetJ family transcription regulator